MAPLPTLAPNRPYVVHRDDAPAYWLVGILWQVLATGAQTGNRYSLMEEVCHGGSGPPTHSHTQDEGFYVLDGQCTFNAGGVSLVAGPGTFIHVPRLTGHSFSVDRDTSRILNFYIPAGFELILMSIAAPAQELAAPAPDAVPMPPPRIVEQLSRDYGQAKVLGLPFVDPPTPENSVTEPSQAAPSKPFGATRDTARSYWSRGILWSVLADGAGTGGAYSVIEQLCPKGSGAPPHTHEQDEAFYLIEGQATFLLGDRQVAAGAGSHVWVPAGTVHGFRVDSETCRLLNVYTPAGFEELVELTGHPAGGLTLPPAGAPGGGDEMRGDPAVVAALMDRLGMRSVAVDDPLRSPSTP